MILGVISASSSIQPTESGFTAPTRTLMRMSYTEEWVITSMRAYSNSPSGQKVYGASYTSPSLYKSYSNQWSKNANMSSATTVNYTKPNGCSTCDIITINPANAKLGEVYYFRVKINDSPVNTWSPIFRIVMAG